MWCNEWYCETNDNENREKLFSNSSMHSFVSKLTTGSNKNEKREEKLEKTTQTFSNENSLIFCHTKLGLWSIMWKKIVEIWHQRNTKTNQVNGNEMKSGQTKKARLVKLGKIVEHKIWLLNILTEDSTAMTYDLWLFEKIRYSS